MTIRIPRPRTKVKQKQLERAIAILRDIGAEEVRPEPTYGIVRVLDFLDDKNSISKQLGNLVCTRVLNVSCKNCPVAEHSEQCVEKLGQYLVTKGPKRRVK